MSGAPDPAPYHAAVAAEIPARAVWLRAADGARLRAVDWNADGASRGTVFLFQGRTEYVEKYSDAATELAARGYATIAIDWRGQGLSDRTGRGQMVGHVSNFSDFQADVDVMIAHATAIGLPRPWHLLGHSMGGLIGLRALHRRPEFVRAAFSAPMWGLLLTPHKRAVGWGVSALGSAVGLGGWLAPGAGKVADPANAPFEGNLLTTDPEMFQWMKTQMRTHPELALGGPSVAWVWAALREMLAQSREAAPPQDCVTWLGSEEAIVSPDAIHVRMASWPNGRLELIEGGRHEVLMEGPTVRQDIYDDLAVHYG